MASPNGWEWLPGNLLNSVLDHITSFADFLRFCGTCEHWRLVALEDTTYHQYYKQMFRLFKSHRNQLPALVIPTVENNSRQRGLYSIIDNTIYDIQLPLAYRRRFCGSSHGWLFTIEKSLVIMLVNPFNYQTIRLPKFNICPFKYAKSNFDFFVHKGILSSNPCKDPSNYQVMIMHDGQLAVLEPGHKAWTSIEHDFYGNDIAYYQGEAYAVNHEGKLIRVDVNLGTSEVVVQPFLKSRPPYRVSPATYLVESCEGDLLMIERVLRHFQCDNEHLRLVKTMDFKVYKLAKVDEEYQWVHIYRIGDQALFLGDNHSMAISTVNVPECQKNCIYYTTYNEDFCQYTTRGVDDDAGIFNLEDGSFGLHFIPKPPLRPKKPPIWVMPNFNCI